MRTVILAVTLLLCLRAAAPAARAAAPLGSSQSVTADPPVPRPAGRPLTVPLFHDLTFTDFSARPFRCVPPAGPARRWARIILVGDFSVSAGRQFDRSSKISIGHTNVFFGTTAEPSATISPAWHVERDLTDYAALFATARPGEVTIGNVVNETYTGVIHGSASLLFYPAAPHAILPPPPDLVLPLPAGKNGVGSADGPADTVSVTYTLPTNLVRATLDLVTESQGSDEFWYMSVPTDEAAKLQSTGGTAFREAEVTVDGRPAGVAPVYPWVYTGGIDPSLWRPIPGLQTLDFVPYRVDLTPFVGVLDNGRPHTIGVRVVNNGSHFEIAGALLLSRDPVLKTVHGALTVDTLTVDPVPVVQTHLVDAPGEVSGPVSVRAGRRFTVAGYVLTSAGRVGTTVTQAVGFSSAQQFDVGGARSAQSVHQVTTVSSLTETRTPSKLFRRRDDFRYPFTVSVSQAKNTDGSAVQTTAILQGDVVSHVITCNGALGFSSQMTSLISPSDSLVLDAAGKRVRRSQSGFQVYAYTDSHGLAYTRTLTAADGVLTSDSAAGLGVNSRAYRPAFVNPSFSSAWCRSLSLKPTERKTTLPDASSRMLTGNAWTP